MAYVRQRITKAGTVSTALVESYRDAQCEPRQRVLANLHGEPDALRALARLTLRQTNLLTERKQLASEKAIDDETGEVIDARRARDVIKFIDAKLAALAREQAILEQHCSSTARNVKAAAQAYQQELTDSVNQAMGRTMYLWKFEDELKKVRAKVRRMRGS